MTALAFGALGIAAIGFLLSIVAYHTAEKLSKAFKEAYREWSDESAELRKRILDEEELITLIDSRNLERLKNDEWLFSCPVCGKLNRVAALRSSDTPQACKLRAVCAHCGIPVGDPEKVKRALKAREES